MYNMICEDIFTTGKIKGKKARDRKREKIWGGLGRWTYGGKMIGLIVNCEDRER